MAGLGRIQQRFNQAVIGVLAALVGFARGGNPEQRRQLEERGHPIAAKYLRTQNVAKATGRDLPPYRGFCSGAQETARHALSFNRSKYDRPYGGLRVEERKGNGKDLEEVSRD